AHVRIDVLSQNFSSRFKARLEILGIALFLTPFLLLVIWYGIDFAERSFSRGERSPVSLGLTHRWIIKSVVPLSALIALMGAWSVLLRIVAHLRGELDEPFVREGLWKS
ncbi:MAG: TRAP transporter small permease subunit, partial [Pseudomonadota bacterium]